MNFNKLFTPFLIFTKIFERYYYTRSNKRKTEYFRKVGCNIGEGNRFNCDLSIMATEPYLVQIGDNNLFAGGVRFITHDGGVKVLNTLNMFGNGKCMDKMGRIRIGNNVFVGFNSLIMGGGKHW